MIRISQIIGALLLLIGVIFMIDLQNTTTNWFGVKIRGNSIPLDPTLQSLLGISFIVIGLFMAIPKLNRAVQGN